MSSHCRQEEKFTDSGHSGVRLALNAVAILWDFRGF
jgi:hypothetical protein